MTLPSPHHKFHSISITYIEDLLNSFVNQCIVLFGGLLKLCRVVTYQLTKHTALTDGIGSNLGSTLHVTAAAG